ncbi:uncharacterized protein RB166_017384 [Leptodactylus fuscus]
MKTDMLVLLIALNLCALFHLSYGNYKSNNYGNSGSNNYGNNESQNNGNSGSNNTGNESNKNEKRNCVSTAARTDETVCNKFQDILKRRKSGEYTAEEFNAEVATVIETNTNCSSDVFYQVVGVF